MKQVFKCDYCSKMGTEEEVREHEPKCFQNYDRRSCYTCIHKKFKSGTKLGDCLYECKVGVEIQEGCIVEFCPKYERKEKPDNLLDGLFSGLFG